MVFKATGLGKIVQAVSVAKGQGLCPRPRQPVPWRLLAPGPRVSSITTSLQVVLHLFLQMRKLRLGGVKWFLQVTQPYWAPSEWEPRTLALGLSHLLVLQETGWADLGQGQENSTHSGSWPTSLGQARSDSGLGCLLTLGVRIGKLLSPSSQAQIPSRGSGRPGSLGPGGGQVWDFCFPVPRSLTAQSLGELWSWPPRPRHLTGSTGFMNFLFQKWVRGYLPLLPCQHPAAGVQRGRAVSPRSRSRLWGPASRHPSPSAV